MDSIYYPNQLVRHPTENINLSSDTHHNIDHYDNGMYGGEKGGHGMVMRVDLYDDEMIRLKAKSGIMEIIIVVVSIMIVMMLMMMMMTMMMMKMMKIERKEVE